MIIFEDNQERVITRRRALGVQNIKINNDVQRGDEVEYIYQETENGRDMVIAKTENVQLDETGEPIYTFITKEFGLFGFEKGFKSLIEVKFCDEGTMIITLIAGSIVIRPDGNIIKASRAVGDSSVPNCKSDEILWINAEKLIQYVGYLAKFASRYPYDYEYYMEIGGSYEGHLESFKIREVHEANDISYGALAVVEAKEKRKEDAKQARKAVRLLSSYNNNHTSNNSDDFDFDDDEDDSDDFDDEEFDY